MPLSAALHVWERDILCAHTPSNKCKQGPISLSVDIKRNVRKVWRERKNQQDAKIRCLLSTSVSTCFGNHYAHLHENKDRMLLHTVYWAGSAVVGGCVVGCEHCQCSHPTTLSSHFAHDARSQEPKAWNVRSSCRYFCCRLAVLTVIKVFSHSLAIKCKIITISINKVTNCPGGTQTNWYIFS